MNRKLQSDPGGAEADASGEAVRGVRGGEVGVLGSIGTAEFGAAETSETRALILRGLEEDLPSGDVTSELLIPEGVRVRAQFVPREDGILCGLPVVAALFREIEPALALRPLRSEGDRIVEGDSFLEIQGPGLAVLRGERLALNFLQRLTGVATLTRRHADLIRPTECLLYDTRKTTPGWRALEKYAVRVGGGRNHRQDLSSFALIKDNHRQILEALGSSDVGGWIERLREVRSEVPVELEVDDLDQLRSALSAECDIVLLDNFSLADLEAAVEMVRAWPGRRPQLEASGGIDLRTVKAVAETGVDRLAVGALTHSAAALDIGLDLVEVSTD